VPRRLLLLALAAPFIFAVPAGAALPDGNLVQNGDAEGGPGATNDTDSQPPPGWDVVPNFTAVVYGTGAFPGTSDSASIGGGANFFAGGPNSPIGDITVAQQRIDLTAAAPEIDGGNVTATLTADLGGFAAQGDSAGLSVVIGDEGGSVGTVAQLPPVTPQDRGNLTGFRRRSACTRVEPTSRVAYVQIYAQRSEGSYNDGYADNVSLTLNAGACPPAEPPPLPPPAPPQPGVSGNAEPVRGRVFVKQPGSNTFQALRDARSIPVGSEINTEKGEVELQTASNTTGAVQIGKFRQGRFVMSQTRGRAPVTDLTLTGGRIDKCPRTGTQTSAAARRPARRLWGNARGRFRTRGRYASATIRGTQWLVRDTCTTTTVQARRGTVIARDLVKRRNVRLKAPKKYTARARKR
jgi:hypothetical protein